MTTIKMVDAAKFYKGLPNQVEAFKFLDYLLTEEQKIKFQDLYRKAPPVVTPAVKQDIYLYCNWSGKYDEYGLKIFGLYLMNGDRVVDKLVVCSGQSYAQDVVWPEDDSSGSMRPCPEGVYDLGAIDDIGYDPGSSDGFGQWTVPLNPRFPLQRSALLLHSDRNRSTSPGCFDIEETEVLTTAGWVHAKDVTLEHHVFQMGNNFELFTAKPLDIIREEYEGGMVLVSSNKLSMLVTPNHRIAKTSVHSLKDWKDDPKPRLNYFEASELQNKEFGFSVPTAGLYNTENDYTEEEVLFERLRIAYLADGYHAFNQTSWHFKKSRKIQRLQKLLADIGIESVVKPAKDGSVVISVGKLPFEKDIDPSYALTLPIGLKIEMLKELIHWDGSTSSGKSKSEKYCCHVGTANKSQAEFYRLLAVTSGWGCKVTEWKDKRNADWSVLYRCNIVEGRIRYGIETKEKLGSLDVATLNDYTGTVFCLTTESSNFVVKHRGEVFITGNSAGCCTTYFEKDMAILVKWLRSKTKPTYLIMDHGLGYLAKQSVKVPNVKK